jgi:hypothetical protein
MQLADWLLARRTKAGAPPFQRTNAGRAGVEVTGHPPRPLHYATAPITLHSSDTGLRAISSILG